jgi:hypothetical protein
MSLKSLMIVLVLAPAVGLAQVATTPPADWTPPPMVPAAPPPMPAPEPVNTQQPGTPPPPSMVPEPGYVPGQQGKTAYQYSPYGQPRAKEKPGPEIGLMVSEGLFGALTAAGITVLPYFLLFAGGGLLSNDPTVNSIVFILIFGVAPVAVAQTEVSVANGSRHYQSETWVAAVTGIVAEAGVLGIFYATGWLPIGQQASGGVPNGGSVVWLMIGSIGLVPLIQMAAINLFKQPRVQAFGTIGDPKNGLGVAFAPPSVAPILGPTSQGPSLGVQLSFLRGNF